MSREAMKLALEAFELLARYENPSTKIQVRKPKDGGPIVTMYPHKVATEAAALLRERLAQPEQEPVAWMYVNKDGECEQIEYGPVFDDPGVTPLYTAPPKHDYVIDCPRCGHCCAERTWVELTDEEIQDLSYLSQKIDASNTVWFDRLGFAKAIEQALKEKNA